MSNYDIQQGIIKAMQDVAKAEIGKSQSTSSKIGIVVKEPRGFNCTVSINGQDIDCQLPEHLHSWIQKNDIVIIQDLYGDGSKKVVTGKTGSVNSDPSLVFFDEESGRNVSGVDIINDESGIGRLDAYGTVEG